MGGHMRIQAQLIAVAIGAFVMTVPTQAESLFETYSFESYNGTFCSVRLWEGGVGYLWSNGSLWNNNTTDSEYFGCPIVTPSLDDKWRPLVEVRDAHSTDSVDAKPYACLSYGVCGWWSTYSSYGQDVDVTLSWPELNKSGYLETGFWVKLPEVMWTTSNPSGLYGYTAMFK